MADETSPNDELRKVRARFVRLLHLRHLGLDPAIKGYRANETRTADALERAIGERLERSAGVGDWRGTTSGRIYDDCSPPRSAFFDRELDNWRAKVIGHATVTQGIDIVTVDVRDRDLTRQQIARAVETLNDLPEAAKRKVLVLMNQDEA